MELLWCSAVSDEEYLTDRNKNKGCWRQGMQKPLSVRGMGLGEAAVSAAFAAPISQSPPSEPYSNAFPP